MSSTNKVILAVLGVLAIAFIAFRLMPPPGTQAPPDTLPPGPGGAAKTALVATITEASGKVTVTRDSSTADANVGDELKAGDVITTGADGQASLEFFASDRVGLDVNTTLEVTEASVDASNWHKQIVRVKLEAGRAWSRALRLLDLQSKYEVTSQNVIMTVRGTAFLVTSSESWLVIDQFDDTLAVSGAVSGTLEPGFSANMNPTSFPATLAGVVLPTPDDVRNNFWVQTQLRKDADFAERATAIRRQNGLNDQAGDIGKELGPFTLDRAGTQHSGFHGVAITAPTQIVALGGTLALKADALITDANGRETTKDVTSLATWQVSDSSIATIDAKGVLTATQKNGPVMIVARWNDGTHEHSGTIVVSIGASIQVDTQSSLEINGVPVQ